MDAVGVQISQLSGPVLPKVKAIDNAALQAIKTSRQVEQICETVLVLGHRCVDHMSLNPIAFEESVVGSSWDELKDAPDYGLSDLTWFGLTIERDSADYAKRGRIQFRSKLNQASFPKGRAY